VLQPGASAPEIKLNDLNGKPFDYQSLKGKVVLLNFWASWCAPCIDEMPALEALYQKLKAQGFVILAIAEDDTLDDLKAFVKEHQLNFPILYDQQAKLKATYGVSGYPETFLINQSGKIVLFKDPNSGIPELKLKGPRDWNSDVMLAEISKLLKEVK
jgi:peroxiredoxin